MWQWHEWRLIDWNYVFSREYMPLLIKIVLNFKNALEGETLFWKQISI